MARKHMLNVSNIADHFLMQSVVAWDVKTVGTEVELLASLDGPRIGVAPALGTTGSGLAITMDTATALSLRETLSRYFGKA
jgi:hypothetical protein